MGEVGVLLGVDDPLKVDGALEAGGVLGVV